MWTTASHAYGASSTAKSKLLGRARPRALECIACRAIFALKKLKKELREKYQQDRAADPEKFDTHFHICMLWEKVKNEKPTSPVRRKDVGLGKKVRYRNIFSIAPCEGSAFLACLPAFVP